VDRRSFRYGHQHTRRGGLRPGTPADLLWSSDCRQVGIKVSPEEIRRELELLLDRPARAQLHLPRRLDLSTGPSRSLLDTIRILGREAGRADGLLSHPLAVANLQHMLIQALLLTQAHNYSEALSDEARPARPGMVRRAIELIRTRPEWPWTSGELARKTGVSVRALQMGFTRSGEAPPMTYLRHLRLAKAHAVLAEASPASVTVTAVASRWGFLHFGRFAQQYRELFGESPSQTLRGDPSASRLVE
jgi:AraC-like DNA-binding protein